MSKCKNMKMLKYTAPSMEIQLVQAMGLILNSSTDTQTSIEGGDQDTAQSPKRRLAKPF